MTFWDFADKHWWTAFWIIFWGLVFGVSGLHGIAAIIRAINGEKNPRKDDDQ